VNNFRLESADILVTVSNRARLVDILPLNPVPLPGDFVTDSLLLEEAWAGKLSEELV